MAMSSGCNQNSIGTKIHLIFCIDCSCELAMSIDTVRLLLMNQSFNTDSVLVSLVLFGVEVCVALHQCGIDQKDKISHALLSAQECKECDVEQGILGAVLEV